MIAFPSSAPPFIDALHTQDPAPDRADRLTLYGWLVGRWDMDVVIHKNDGTSQRTHGFVSAGWVLEGRALQDVFAAPGLFYGTTLRVYDPGLDAWHIVWTDPLHQVFVTQIGRASGNDIVQEGEESPSLARLYGVSHDGRSAATIRWIFSDIGARSFRWRSERSTDGVHWQLQREFFARRVGT